uniref:V-type proton ATPase subunit E n=1 Tax=Fibrocapsa japonica TaxID=94617 RepID=A0A7S2V0J1_9STRA|mmetsp:Transcript_22275/g.32343  ORF Transcript_22275/g.32343 Transcript_22275/m.32343 type:complete len:226 (+) Transcript_22275:159-836(+)
MDSSQSSKQIKQMVNFILQEAHEKANEIHIKTEHDFNLEKQMLVHNAKLRIQEEYTQKEKDREVQDRIARSSKVGAARVKKMVQRDDLLKDLQERSLQACKQQASGPQYEQLLQKLMVQGLIKMGEKDVQVLARQVDVQACKRVSQAAVQEYYDVMKKEASQDVTGVTIEVNENADAMLPARSAGGIVMTAFHDRIVLDNTFDTRLQLAYSELLPQVRAKLFPAV